MITYFVQSEGLYVAYGLSSDTKPVSPPNNCLFIETDTGVSFCSSGATWVTTPLATGSALVLSDVTDNNATTSRHGFLPKLGGGSVNFLRADGTWVAPTASASWGSITGVLSTQTDLVNELALKAPLISPTLTTPILGVATATTINGATITSGTLNGTVTGTNTGDNATNTQYSGLATSKQDTLVSSTNIKTINGSSVLGSGNLTVSGETSITEVEIDFGSVPIKSKQFTITDGTIVGTNKITATLSYANPSDGETDSAEWFENLTLMARAGTGNFVLYANSPYKDLNGKVKINYIKG